MGHRSSRRLRKGTDGVLYQKTWTGSSWSGWQSLSGKLASSPAATSPASGKIDVCVRGTDGALYQKTYNGAWSGWVSAGGHITPSPRAPCGE